MDIALIITVIGTILTAIGTFYTLYQSGRIKKYKKEILEELNRINLIQVSELLKNAQAETRKLLYPDSQIARGTNLIEVINSIQKSIDDSLSLVNLDDKDKVLRNKIIDSQKKFRDYNSNPNNQMAQEEYILEFHILLQECISIARTNANKILGE